MHDPFDFIMTKVIGLPLELTERSPSAAVRVLGMAAQFVWFFPAMVACMLPLLVVGVVEVFRDAYRGEYR